LVLRTFLAEKTSITEGLPGFAALFAILNSSTDEVMALMDELGITTKGTTAGKQQTKDLLALKIAEMAGMARAFAVIEGDVQLQKLMQIAKSKLVIASDLKLIGKAKEVLEKIVALGGKLTRYGITEQHIADLTALIEQYTLTMPQPRSGIDDRKHTNEELLALLKTGDVAIEKMDALVEIVRYSNELFYTDYYTRRKIIDKGSRTRALQLLVLDDVTGLPVAKAKVTVRFKAGTELAKVVRSTGGKGGVVVGSMDAGEYEYEVSYGGYLTSTGSFFVNDGVMTEVVVRLKK
jgi:5-hydroxyisourate hydrolase-like protein (transthyretin family)